MHFYNSTSLILQRQVVFGLNKPGIVDIAVNAAKLCRKLEETIPDTKVFYEYSPESYTGTEVRSGGDLPEAVMDVIEATPERKIVLNLPATVEMYTPNLYADTIEWFLRQISRRDRLILSLHPHNDRGCAVAAELSVLAGADRVEHALQQQRAHRQRGRDHPGHEPLHAGSTRVSTSPRSDSLRRVAEYCNRLPVHPRHPYAGDLVYTAFLRLPSGRHQEGHGGPAQGLRDVGGPLPPHRPEARGAHLRER